MKKHTQDEMCRCGSGQPASACCRRLINGIEPAITAEALMRSRFVAYATGQAAYVLSTWHSSTRPAQLEMPQDLKWTGLKVVQHRQLDEQHADVEFVASFVSDAGSGQMHELSRFVKEQGRWFYVDGDPLETGSRHRTAQPGRNDPCYCGSGKKFKKCCGKA